MKFKKLFVLCLVLFSSLFLVACGGTGGGSGNAGGSSSKKEVEDLKATMEAINENFSIATRDNFCIKYYEDSQVKLESYTIGFDKEKGHFYCNQYLKEKVGWGGAEPEEYTFMTYVWVDGTTITTTSYMKKPNFNNGAPEKKYWVVDYHDEERAMETFIDQFEWVSETTTFMHPFTPDTYLILVEAEKLEYMLTNVNDYLSSTQNRWAIKVNSQSELSFDMTADFKSGETKQSFSMVVENGALKSYTDEGFLNCTISVDYNWTLEKPDLSTYHSFS